MDGVRSWLYGCEYFAIAIILPLYRKMALLNEDLCSTESAVVAFQMSRKLSLENIPVFH